MEEADRCFPRVMNGLKATPLPALCKNVEDDVNEQNVNVLSVVLVCLTRAADLFVLLL